MRTSLRLHLFLAAAALLLGAAGVHAQEKVAVVGTGTVSILAYGDTVTGDIAWSEAGGAVAPISYVGHNGANRTQGDFDVWQFDARAGDNAVIQVTATGGDLIPRLLLVGEPDATDRILGVSAWDGNEDGDASAGACLRGIYRDRRYAIVVARADGTAQTGTYTLTLEHAADAAALSGGSATAVCRVGTFVVANGTQALNVRAGEGTRFAIKTTMQPGAPYALFGGVSDWTHILYPDGDGIGDGYVRSDLVHLTGAESRP